MIFLWEIRKKTTVFLFNPEYRPLFGICLAAIVLTCLWSALIIREHSLTRDLAGEKALSVWLVAMSAKMPAALPDTETKPALMMRLEEIAKSGEWRRSPVSIREIPGNKIDVTISRINWPDLMKGLLKLSADREVHPVSLSIERLPEDSQVSLHMLL